MQLHSFIINLCATMFLGSFYAVYGTSVTSASSCRLVYTFRKWGGGDFIMTSDQQEAQSIGMNFGIQKDNFMYLGAPFRLEGSSINENWVPLYRYNNGALHFFSSDPNEIGVTRINDVGNSNYKCEGIIGYISKAQQPNTVPLHRFYLPLENQGYLYVLETNSSYWMKRADPAAKYTKIEGYVYPA